MKELRAANGELEKKQQKFDQSLAEVKAKVDQTAAERDMLAQENREKESKVTWRVVN